MNLYSLSGVWSVGYDLAPSQSLRVAPLVGVGATLANLVVRAEEVGFDTYSTNHYPRSFYQGSLQLHGGIAADYLFDVTDKNKTVSVGLRAGYLFDPRSTRQWRSEKTRITGGPDFDYTTVYASVVLSKSGNHRNCEARECKHRRGGCKKKHAQ
jgi:hypothetical protein